MSNSYSRQKEQVSYTATSIPQRLINVQSMALFKRKVIKIAKAENFMASNGSCEFEVSRNPLA